VHPDCSSYFGDWVEDRPHGKGVENYPGGTTYSGEYQRGKKQGMGRLEWSTGQYY
jgi:hypothetical protein